MRTLIAALLLLIVPAMPLHAGQEPENPSPSADDRPLELGNGVVLPRHAFDEIMAREDGLGVIERMHQRAEETRRFEGMPHLMVIFVAVLLFFWSAMFYYQRKHARLHRTIQLMIEKGLPVPTEILRAAEQFDSGKENAAGNVDGATPPWASNLMWGGILWITIGITGIAYLWLRDSDAWPWGIAAIAYGAAASFTALGKREKQR